MSIENNPLAANDHLKNLHHMEQNKYRKGLFKTFLYTFLFSILCVKFISTVQAAELHKEKNVVIIGGGHIGLIEALQAFQRAEKMGEKIRLVMFEKNARAQDTTAANIWNSHTPDEIVSVVPRGVELTQKLKIAFSKPGGIRVDDVSGVNDSEVTQHFINQVRLYGQDSAAHQARTTALLALGKAGMNLWKGLFEAADDELKAILMESNFNPCYEAQSNNTKLHNGYRIDLIYGIPNAINHAKAMTQKYQKLGYKNSQILSPDEVVKRDPVLAKFCDLHSVGELGQRQWKNNSVALWRPGGCIDTQTFLPKLVNYLRNVMGTYTKKDGTEANRFQLRFNTQVTGIILAEGTSTQAKIKGLRFADNTQTEENAFYTNSTYVFCPGESVGTLKKLGFNEPAFAGFSGASLSLMLTSFDKKAFKEHNHTMEVHKEGIVLAWQSRVRDGKLFLGAAGTKAYYGDKSPTTQEAFSKDRNLLQLRIMNDVLPQVISIALERDTTGEELSQKDLNHLEKIGIAKRWVGRRAVAYDGFPTLGRVYLRGKMLSNARTTTHLGSGGGSFSLITSLISAFSMDPSLKGELDALNLDSVLIGNVLRYSDSRRTANEHS